LSLQVKPDGGSQGDGISLTTDPCRTTSWNSAAERVVQEYVSAPLLVDGLKFDLRLYVLLCRSADGMERAFLCHEGLARFAVDDYLAPAKDNLRNVHMHLTNYSLNKKAQGFKHSEEEDGGDGSKRTVSATFKAIEASGKASADSLWAEIGALVYRTLAVLRPVLAAAQTSQPFAKVTGFDVLLDEQCRPWLIEINDHPSLRIDLSYDEPGQYSMNGLNSVPSPVDEAIKVDSVSSSFSRTDGWSVISTFRGTGRLSG